MSSDGTSAMRVSKKARHSVQKWGMQRCCEGQAVDCCPVNRDGDEEVGQALITCVLVGVPSFRDAQQSTTQRASSCLLGAATAHGVPYPGRCHPPSPRWSDLTWNQGHMAMESICGAFASDDRTCSVLEQAAEQCGISR